MEENVLNCHGLVRHMWYWTPLHGLIDQRTLETVREDISQKKEKRFR